MRNETELPTKRELLKWINALRSGEYKQGKRKLQGSEGYCCLGVACEVVIPKNKIQLSGKYIAGYMPSAQKHSPRWLDAISDNVEKVLSLNLQTLNDQKDYSFEEIADCLILFGLEKEIIK